MKVTVSISMSKTIDIPESDDVKQAVIDSYCLPNEAYIFMPHSFIQECLRDWIVDDFEVIKEE